MYKLLIVDDEEIERRAIEYIISNSNMNISEMQQATNGQDAVAKSSVFEPDIIIMDINMPGLNGIKAAAVIKKFLPTTHIIFLTAFDEFDHAKEAIKLGADDFIVKPASAETLEKAIINSIKNIEHSIEQLNRKKKTENKLKGASTYLKECLVEAFILGESDIDKINKYLSFTNIDFDYSYGAVASADFEKERTRNPANVKAKKIIIYDRLKNEINKTVKKNITYLKGDCLYLFVYDTSKEKIVINQAGINEAFDRISKYALSVHRIEMDFANGSISESVDKIWRSFSGAKKQIYKKIKVEFGNFSKDILSTLANDIISNRVNSINNQLVNVQNILVSENTNMEDYRVKLLEFSILLKKNIILTINRPIIIDDGLYIIASKTKSYDEGANFLSYYCDKLCEICAMDEEKDKNIIIVGHMAEYIKEHIAENITLEKMSEVSKLSSYYISRLFKKCLKMNFSDYVTYVRIKNAKNLLKNPYLSIKEISFKSGYADPNYFARVFKKETQISPTTFRKRHMDAKEN